MVTPIYATSTFSQSSVGEHKGYDYSRTGNPTRSALETCLAALEAPTFGCAFSSGMSAIDAVLRLLQPGDHVLIGNDVYGGTYRLLSQVHARAGLRFDPISFEDPADVAACLAAHHTHGVGGVAFEPHAADRGHRCSGRARPCPRRAAGRGQYVRHPVPPTTARPGGGHRRPLDDEVPGGHSDVVGRLCRDVASRELSERIAFLQNAVGAVPSPFDCFLVLRGVKTLAVRMERHCANAARVAEALSAHPDVEHVYYPGLPDHRGHTTARAQMRAFGGMVSFTVRGGEERSLKVASSTSIFTLAESLGAVESLIEHPGRMTHASLSDSILAVDPSLLRLSVGLEDVDDLVADLQLRVGTAFAD